MQSYHWTPCPGRGRGLRRRRADPGCSRWCGVSAASGDSSAGTVRTPWRPRGAAAVARPGRDGEPPRGPYPSRLAAAARRAWGARERTEWAWPGRPITARRRRRGRCHGDAPEEGCGNAIMEATERELVLCLLKAQHIRLMPGSIWNEKMKWGAVTTAVYYRVSPTTRPAGSWLDISSHSSWPGCVIKLLTSPCNYQVCLAYTVSSLYLSFETTSLIR